MKKICISSPMPDDMAKINHRLGICQFIGFSPTASKKAFTLENGLLPKNPLNADNGLGCADSTMKCFGLVIIFFFLRAGAPHKIKANKVFTFI